MPEELPERLTIIPLPIGGTEYAVNELAREYNSLPSGNSRRKSVYQRYKEAVSKADWD